MNLCVNFCFWKTKESELKTARNSFIVKVLRAVFIGRGTKARTLDTRFWRPLLYQLSYTPILRRRDAADVGAGDGNRTRTTSLEGWDSTIELLPQIHALL